jgi:hypothetical protein
MHEPADLRIPVRAEILTHELTDSDEIVIYDGQNRQLLVLNDFAAGIWLLIDGKRTVSELGEVITDSVTADAETVAKDVRAFLEQLAKRNIVTWRTP